MRRVIVVGSGIGGLAAAIALERSRYEVLVLEQAPDLTEVGAEWLPCAIP
jgi:2-polyprenyl-6-methoxyphenol hydroxylase-like FAD-dependent oxidoreductase